MPMLPEPQQPPRHDMFKQPSQTKALGLSLSLRPGPVAAAMPAIAGSRVLKMKTRRKPTTWVERRFCLRRGPHVGILRLSILVGRRLPHRTSPQVSACRKNEVERLVVQAKRGAHWRRRRGLFVTQSTSRPRLGKGWSLHVP